MKKIVRTIVALLLVFGLGIFEVCPAAASSDNTAGITLKDGKIAAGAFQTVWVNSDGTVGAIGREKPDEEVSEWENIVKVAAYHNIIGLKSDGTVLLTKEFIGKHETYSLASNLTDVVDIDANECNIAFLTSEGNVVVLGSNSFGQCDVSSWHDIVDIALGIEVSYGLKANGTVVAMGGEGIGQKEVVRSWTDVIAISAGNFHVVGLKADGTVVATGLNKEDQCEVSEWKDIVAVRAGANHTVGLRADGTVVATGSNDHDQCDVDDWTDIVEIDAGFFHTIGRKADGTIVAVGSNGCGQCF